MLQFYSPGLYRAHHKGASEANTWSGVSKTQVSTSSCYSAVVEILQSSMLFEFAGLKEIANIKKI